MSGASKKLMGTTAAGGELLAIEDVFSTYLYTGNAITRNIVNGIDLAGEGGLVWTKARGVDPHILYDTERGVTVRLSTNDDGGQTTDTNEVTAFNSDGYTVNQDGGGVNGNGNAFASWTFRKAPRFFDVVTYTGDGVAGRTIPHNLGVEPGCIVVKRLNGADNWTVYHRGIDASAPEDYIIYLNTTDARSDQDLWADTAPTDSVFSVGDNIKVNGNSSNTYVAYLFAHDPLGPSGDGSDGLIACGSYTGTGGSGLEVELGWEPQWLVVKEATDAGDWRMFDNMRGWVVGGDDAILKPNSSGREADFAFNAMCPTATGFKLEVSNNDVNASGQTYIYIAIRRGPMRLPESGTEVFQPYVTTSISPSGSTSTSPSPATYDVGFPPDMVIQRNKSGTDGSYIGSRLTGTQYMKTETTAAETSSSAAFWDSSLGAWLYNASYGTWNFRRAPGFFDVVAYTGTGSARTVPHNLGVAPELIIFKARNTSDDNWFVYAAPLGPTKGLYLNATNAAITSPGVVNDTAPTESVFSTSAAAFTNINTTTYIAYLFATLPGVSKVGSYTGNGSSQTIDCGFTSGARFILIKRTDSTGDWYVWDTARGIVTGNDPFLELNTTDAEVTSDDSIDPDSSGFIVNQTGTTNVNVSSASYIFLAIS